MVGPARPTMTLALDPTVADVDAIDDVDSAAEVAVLDPVDELVAAAKQERYFKWSERLGSRTTHSHILQFINIPKVNYTVVVEWPHVRC